MYILKSKLVIIHLNIILIQIIQKLNNENHFKLIYSNINQFRFNSLLIKINFFRRQIKHIHRRPLD
jgi:hypothetical protein